MSVRIIAVLIVTAGVLATSAFATEYTWNGTGSGSWTDSAMWTPTGYPQTLTDAAFFQGTLTAGLTISVPPGNIATVATIRSVMSGTPTTILSFSGGFVMPDGATILQEGPATLELKNTASISMLGALALTNNSLEQFDVNSAFVGGGNLIMAPISNAFRVTRTVGGTVSPLFTGEVWIGGRGSTTKDVRFNSALTFTNSRAYVVKPGGFLSSYLNNIITFVPPVVLEGNPNGNATLSSGGAGANTTIIPVCRVSGVTNVWHVKNANCHLRFTGVVEGTGVVSLTGNAAGSNSVLGAVSPGFGTGTLTLAWSSGGLELGRVGDPLELMIEDGDLLRVEGLFNALDIALMDVTFTTLTGADVTNWFLYSGSGFAGGAFHAVNFSPPALSGYVVSNVAGMENYVGAVVTPEPLLALSAWGVVMAALRRKH